MYVFWRVIERGREGNYMRRCRLRPVIYLIDKFIASLAMKQQKKRVFSHILMMSCQVFYRTSKRRKIKVECIEVLSRVIMSCCWRKFSGGKLHNLYTLWLWLRLRMLQMFSFREEARRRLIFSIHINCFDSKLSVKGKEMRYNSSFMYSFHV